MVKLNNSLTRLDLSEFHQYAKFSDDILKIVATHCHQLTDFSLNTSSLIREPDEHVIYPYPYPSLSTLIKENTSLKKLNLRDGIHIKPVKRPFNGEFFQLLAQYCPKFGELIINNYHLLDLPVETPLLIVLIGRGFSGEQGNLNDLMRLYPHIKATLTVE